MRRRRFLRSSERSYYSTCKRCGMTMIAVTRRARRVKEADHHLRHDQRDIAYAVELGLPV